MLLVGSEREILAMAILAVALADRARNEGATASVGHRRSSGKYEQCALRWSILMAGCQVLKAQVLPVMKVKRTSSAAPRDGRK
jgi:hypothetical protein